MTLSKNSQKSQKIDREMPGQTLQILGVRINSTSADSVLDFVVRRLAKKEKFWIATPNPEMVVLTQTDLEFKKVLNAASWVIPDGIGLVWASRLQGQGLKGRLTGVDLMEKLCQESAKRGWKVFLLGGRGRVAQEALEALQGRHKGLKGMAEGGPQKLVISNSKLVIGDIAKDKGVQEKINFFKPDLLFVAFGMGKQERWIVKYFDRLNIGGAMVVGGAFDFISGRVRRAPPLVQNLGLEWFWRLILGPWRMKRQISLLKFIFLVLKEKFGK